MFPVRCNRLETELAILVPVSSQRQTLWVHSKGSHQVEVCLHEDNTPQKVERCKGIPFQPHVTFFSRAYAITHRLCSGGYAVEFFGRVLGGGNANSAYSDKPGARITRSFDAVGRNLAFGTLHTQQEIEDEIQKIMLSINQDCSQTIRSLHKIPPQKDFSILSRLDESLDRLCQPSANNLDSVLANIDARMNVLRDHASNLGTYSVELSQGIDSLNGTMHRISEHMATTEKLKRRIEQLKADRYYMTSAIAAVGALPVALGYLADDWIFDPWLGAKPGTDLASFLQGYDCMGRPPTRLEDVIGWLADAGKLLADMQSRKQTSALQLCTNEAAVRRMQELRVQMAMKKIDTAMGQSLAALASECRQITASLR